MKIYIIGSLANPRVPEIAKQLRELGHGEVFDDWYSPGKDTDKEWQAYEKQRGRTFREALRGHHAQHAFALDKKHLDECDAAVLVAPAGKSAHLELGYVRGLGKPAYIFMDGEPDRFDLMYLFATEVFTDFDALAFALANTPPATKRPALTEGDRSTLLDMFSLAMSSTCTEAMRDRFETVLRKVLA